MADCNGGDVSSSISSVNGITGVCCVIGVSHVSGCVSEITRVWEEADSIPVYSIASQPQVVRHSRHIFKLCGMNLHLVYEECLQYQKNVVESPKISDLNRAEL